MSCRPLTKIHAGAWKAADSSWLFLQHQHDGLWYAYPAMSDEDGGLRGFAVDPFDRYLTLDEAVELAPQEADAGR